MLRNILWLSAAFVLVFGSTSWAQSRPAQIPVDVFASLDGFTGARLSPNGEYMAYLYALDGRYNLVVHEFSSGQNIKVIPPIDKLDFNWLRWANDSIIVFSMSYTAARYTTETTETRLISFNIENDALTSLVKPAEKTGRTGSRTAREYYAEPQIQDRVLDWLINDPRHILVILDEDFDIAYEIRKIDVYTGDYSLYRKPTQGIQNWILDRAGKPRLGYGYKKGKSWALLRDESGDWIPLSRTDWYEYWMPKAFTEDPSVIYVTGYGNDMTRELRTLDVETGTFVDTVHSHPDYDFDGFLTHPLTGAPAGYSYFTDNEVQVYFDPDLAKLQQSIDKVLPGMHNSIASASRNLRKLLIVSSNSREPGGLFIWNRDAGTVEPFGWFNENLDPELLSTMQAVEYESADGTIIPAYLTLPLGREPSGLPAVVMPHGGPALRTDQSYWFLTQFLASRGYAVLQPNFRGSTGYGYEFMNAGRGQWGGLMQDDVDAGARWLAEQGVAESGRICIVGWSYGGYSAAMGLIKSPELYKCGAGINGVYNLPGMIAYDKQYIGGSSWVRHIGLDGESTRSVSPHHLTERFQAPFLIIHAEDDARVNIDQAKGLHRKLLDADNDSTLVTVSHGGHSMRDSAARRRILTELEHFLSSHLERPPND